MPIGDVELVVVPDAEAAAAAAAALLVAAADADGSFVLAGGSTPRRAYELAAERHSDWGGAELWYGDDRCVPADDERSNQRLVQESLLDRVLVPPIVHPIPTRLAPRGGGRRLRRRAARADPRPRPARPRAGRAHGVALPRTLRRSTSGSGSRVAVEPGLEPFVERITLTIPALESGGHVVFLAVGEGKADAVRRAFAEEPSPSTPASLVRSRNGVTTAILDEAAAVALP